MAKGDTRLAEVLRELRYSNKAAAVAVGLPPSIMARMARDGKPPLLITAARVVSGLTPDSDLWVGDRLYRAGSPIVTYEELLAEEERAALPRGVLLRETKRAARFP